ncbi:MAG: Crp/Fnr family transcriptional regulator [Desulfuromonadaceae bacterium]|nr:Crp/Fnr family transcriptional regulator [Desulfuromonadaceae bacterium]
MDKNAAVTLFMQAFFGTAETPEHRALVEQSSRFIKVEKRHLLFNEGDEGSEFYFLAQGKVKLYRATEDGKEAVIRLLEKGEYFAEILLQLKRRYPVSALALEKSELLAIDAQKILAHIESNPAAAMQFIGALSQRIKYLLGMVEQLTLSDIRERFVTYLMTLSDKQGSKLVRLPAAKGEVALLLGTTAETFSRLLSKLAAEGSIRIEGRDIYIEDTDALHEKG